MTDWTEAEQAIWRRWQDEQNQAFIEVNAGKRSVTCGFFAVNGRHCFIKRHCVVCKHGQADV